MSKTKPIPTLTPEQVERFWSKVDRRGNDDCWEWQGALYSNGWTTHFLPSGQYGASRIAYALYNNTDPGVMEVCHRCDNPRCVNPTHLFLGTRKDNMHDCHLKGRTARGEGHGRHKLTWQEVLSIRASEGTCRAVGNWFNVSAATVCLIRNFKKWNHNAPSL
jgi:hypothetical protein